MAETETRKRARKVADKLLLVGIAVAIIAPFAILYALNRETPTVCESAEDLAQLSAEDELIVTRRLKDEDLTELDRFTQLKELQLYFSDVTDAGMPHIGRHTGMRRLVLAAEPISDTGIAELAPLTELEHLLLLGCTRVTSSGLSFLPRMKLKSLMLQRLAEVDDGLGAILVQCDMVEKLELRSLRGISDVLVAELAGMQSLKALAIENCPQITTASVKPIAGMVNLEALSLKGLDTLTDEALLELASLKKLKKLYLPERAELSEEAIDKLKQSLPDCKFIK